MIRSFFGLLDLGLARRTSRMTALIPRVKYTVHREGDTSNGRQGALE